MDKESLEEVKETESAEDTEHETEISDSGDDDERKRTDNDSELEETNSQGFRNNNNAWKEKARNLAAKIPRPPNININKQLLLTKIFYFFFFAAVGSLLPFLGVYYKQLWLSAKQVGILIGVRPTVKLLCSPLWGMVSDTYNKPKMVLLVATLGWLIGYYGQSFVSPSDMPCYNSTAYANATIHDNNTEKPLIYKRRFQVKEFLKIPDDVGQPPLSDNAEELRKVGNIKSNSRMRRGIYISDDDFERYYGNYEDRFKQQVGRVKAWDYVQKHMYKSPFSNTKKEKVGRKEEMGDDIFSQNSNGILKSAEYMHSPGDGFDGNIPNRLSNIDTERNLNHLVEEETKRKSEIERNIFNKRLSNSDETSNEQYALEQKKLELSESMMQDSTKNQNSASQKMQVELPPIGAINDGLHLSEKEPIDNQERNLPKNSKDIEKSDEIRIRNLKDGPSKIGKKNDEKFPRSKSLVVENKNKIFKEKRKTFLQQKNDISAQKQSDQSESEDKGVGGDTSPFFPSEIADDEQYDDVHLTHVSAFTGPKVASPHPPEDYRVLYNKYIFLILLTIIILSEILATPAPMVVDSGTLQLLEMYGKRKDYGKQRLFGSIGWILGAVIAGSVVTANSSCNFTDTVNYGSCFHVFAAFMAMTFVVASFFEFETAPKLEYEISRETMWKALKSFSNVRGIGFLITVFFCGFWHSTFMSFLFWFLQDIEGIPIIYALVLVLNSLTEVVVFFTSDFIIEYWTNVGMIYMGLVCYGVRFLFYTYLERPWLVLPMEVLQGFTFGGVWTAAMNYVNNMKGANPSHQSLLHGVYWGLGMAVGGIVSGIMIDAIGTRLTFLINSAAVLVILGIFWLTNKNDVQAPQSSTSSSAEDVMLHKQKRRLCKTSSRSSVGPLGPLVPSLLYGKHFV